MDIINEYRTNFPTAEIVLSTWEGEYTDNLSCKVIKSKIPSVPESHKTSTVNFQIVGSQEGLKNLNTDIIMKCRSDQFIHNKKIFDIFKNSCSPEKIMIPNLGTAIRKVDYRTSDFCQIAYRSVLLEFWNIPLYDGFPFEEAARYLTKNYVLKIKNDHEPWELTLRKYFCVKSFHDDFQIEWEKLNNSDIYKNTYDISFSYNASVET